MMPGRNTSFASPDFIANRAPMPMPTRLLNTNWTVWRWAIRTMTIRAARPTLIASASCSSRVVSQRIVNATVGTAPSIIPRTPPSALASWARTSCSTVAYSAAMRVWAAEGLLASVTRSHSLSLGQLVSRVVQDPDVVDAAESAVDGDLVARIHPGDPAPAEPDQGHRARTVVELGLERGDSAPGPQRHGLQGAVHGHDVAVVALRDRRAGVLGGGVEQLLCLELVGAGGEPVQSPPHDAHISTVDGLRDVRSRRSRRRSRPPRRPPESPRAASGAGSGPGAPSPPHRVRRPRPGPPTPAGRRDR